MLPVIAIVGAPNVGKSTLFNRLTRTRDALVADEPGVTRDRHYGLATQGARRFALIDTGGVTDESAPIPDMIAKQAHQAMDEAHAIIFVVDGRAGANALDERIATSLRRLDRPVYLAVNKAEGLDRNAVGVDFHALGLGSPQAISAAHGQGVKALVDQVLDNIELDDEEELQLPDDDAVKVAVIGKPNVGKSTLINRLLGEDRLVAHDMPGTTRDSIAVPFERDGRSYVLIDTAGIRRRSRIDETVEKFSVIKSLQSIDAANVVVLLIDAREGVADQDATLLAEVEKVGRALVVGINKWDGLTPDQRATVKRQLDIKLGFVDYATVQFLSALHGTGVGELIKAVDKAWQGASKNLSTPELTRLLEAATTRHPPPLVRGRRIKLRYAHQGGSNPPRIVIHGNQTDDVPDAYRRYLARFFRQHLKLHGTPVSVEFRTGDNPYKGRKNTLTPRQVRRKKRLLKHVKR